MAKYNMYVEDVSVEALVNKMGGMSGVKKFLRDELVLVTKAAAAGKEKVKAAVSDLLSLVTTIVLPAQPTFIAKDHFVVDTSEKAPVKIWAFGDNFKSWFLGATEKPTKEARIVVHKLLKDSRDPAILEDLGDKAKTTLSQFYAALKAQASGESGPLLVNGYANIFYIEDVNGSVRAVDAYWLAGNGGWDVFARGVVGPDSWGAGSQVVSRK